MKNRLWLTIVTAAFCGLPSIEAVAKIEKKMVAKDMQFENYLGLRSVTIRGDVLVSGAPLAKNNGPSGAVYIFKKDGFGEWSQTEKIVPSGPQDSGTLGYSTDFDGTRIIAGAINNAAQGQAGGAAYIIDWPSKNIHTLAPKDLVADDMFGTSVSIDGDYAIVGTSAADPKKNGSAYIFERNINDVWEQKAKISGKSRFGEVVAIRGSRALLRSGLGDSVYVYERVDGKWLWTSTIVPPKASQGFGSSLDLDGDYIVVRSHPGVVYVYRDLVPGDKITSFWYLEATLSASDAQLGDPNKYDDAFFGSGLSISGDYIAVGSRFHNTVKMDDGAIYIYKKTVQGKQVKWPEVKKITANDPLINERLGLAVNIDGCHLAAGAALSGQSAGLIYYFSDIGIPCD